MFVMNDADSGADLVGSAGEFFECGDGFYSVVWFAKWCGVYVDEGVCADDDIVFVLGSAGDGGCLGLSVYAAEVREGGLVAVDFFTR